MRLMQGMSPSACVVKLASNLECAIYGASKVTDFEEVKELLLAATVAGGVDEESIRQAEAKLGIRFPPSYRAFVSHFGAALCRGFELAGLFDAGKDDDGPPLWSDVVAATTQRRRISGGLIPNEYVPVSDDGGDYTFFLDMSRANAEGECPVVAIGPGADAVVVAEDFFDFVKRSFEGSLSF
jgi:cell wall assembly regulator SMI1